MKYNTAIRRKLNRRNRERPGGGEIIMKASMKENRNGSGCEARLAMPQLRKSIHLLAGRES